MKIIKAIETEYNSVKYRSKNEARWAVFLDCLGIDFEYEPQGYEMTDGDKTIKYLPDFFIPKSEMFDKDLYLEIKPSNKDIIISDYDSKKVDSFGFHKRITILGSVKDYENDLNHNSGQYDCSFGDGGGWDCGYMFCQCTFCGCFGYEFNGRSARIDCCDENNDLDDKRYNADASIIMKALEEARIFRFWK
jgi:hypothetical protein